jgi:hypothetical protein
VLTPNIKDSRRAEPSARPTSLKWLRRHRQENSPETSRFMLVTSLAVMPEQHGFGMAERFRRGSRSVKRNKVARCGVRKTS